jgi:two-component system CitB family sensor kinase
MASKGRIDPRLATQVLVLQMTVVALTLVVAFGVFAFFSHQRIRYEYGIRALDIARVLASAPLVRSSVAGVDGQPSALSPHELAHGPLQAIATDVQHRTDMLFVVITNDAGLRLAHPDVAELGKPTSTAATAALAGREEVDLETGTLGPSVAAKVPVLAPNSQRVVGEVSVGISTAVVHQQLWRNVRTAAVLGGVILLLSAVASFLLARRWRALTLGLRPTEMAEMVRGQAAVLHGIGEGVVAADADWRTTFVNDEASRLLGIDDQAGRPVADIGLTPRVLDVFRAAAATPALANVNDRIVVVSARPVERDGRNLGTVLVVRDRTDVESLTRQLDAVQLMSSALRAQRHEFANRLHLLNGLLHAGHTEEAAQYVEELLGTGPLGSAVPGIEVVRDPFLQAFLAAKAATAREAGVTLTIGENSWVPGRLALPVDVTTVLGNLVDNAIDATHSASGDVKEVEVELLQEESTLFITVADSGGGVSPDFVDDLFVEGTTTKPDSGIPGGRGIGLALSRQLSRGLGGELRLSSAGNPDVRLCGAEFIARLPGVMIVDDIPEDIPEIDEHLEEEAEWTT